MNQIIMACMAFGVVLGGIDRMLDNRFGLGERFEEGFMLLGPLALSMPGILCLVPALSGLLSTVFSPVCDVLHLDPGTFGGILAIDMGGYQLAESLARNPAIGRFAGIILSATFGCTIIFTIPVGIALIPHSARQEFLRGILIGLMVLPISLLAGGMVQGLSTAELLQASFPILVLAVFLCLGMVRFPDQMIRGFEKAAGGIRIISTAGLVLAAVRSLTGFALIPGMIPLEEAMKTVCSIAVVMLGSLPLAEFLKRLLMHPIRALGRRTGMNADGATALLVGAVSVTPALGMYRNMDSRSRVINGAALVSGASAFAAHIGFTLAVEPQMVSPLLAAKMTGMAAGIAAALLVTGRERQNKRQ